jgi:hypothetical protein
MEVQLQPLFKICAGGRGQRYSPTVLLPENNSSNHIITVVISNLFMLDIYDYIPKTNHVSTVYSVAAILYLQLVLHDISHVKCVAHFYICTFRNICAAPSLAVFYSPSILCFPDELLRYFLDDFEMFPVAPVATGITLVCTCHIRCIYNARSLSFQNFSALS